MLTTAPPLDSIFSNPVDELIENVVRNITKDIIPLESSSDKERFLPSSISSLESLLKKLPPTPKAAPKQAMNQIEPEDDLRSLVYNDQQLNLCGYYYGNLSWLDSSQLLRSTAEGTFLVRDSEHGSYLYTLSVQTSKGPTSCRIEYIDGRFRLDSAKSLSHKMPFFDCVPHLIDYYVQLSQSLPGKKSFSPIWLNMDEENTMNVPVKISKPRYKQVRGLMHMCRVEMAKHLKVNHTAKAVFRTMDHPSNVVSRTIEQDSKYKEIPKLIKDYLKHYPYSQ